MHHDGLVFYDNSTANDFQRLSEPVILKFMSPLLKAAWKTWLGHFMIHTITDIHKWKATQTFSLWFPNATSQPF